MSVCVTRPVRDFGPPPLPAGARGGARGGGRPPGVVQRATCAVVIAGAWPLLGPARPATRRVDAVSVCVGRFVTLAPPPLPERVLFIGTKFSILYTSMHSPA